MNTINLARPYAKAAFNFALNQQQLDAWENMLVSLANMAKDPQVKMLLQNPKYQIKPDQLFIEICQKVLDESGKNFVRLLAEHKRLMLLPAILTLFQTFRAEAEKTVTVNITSALALNDKQQQAIQQALMKRLQQKISLQCEVDPAILGGAIIRAGDSVIDGSLHGKLTRLLESL